MRSPIALQTRAQLLQLDLYARATRGDKNLHARARLQCPARGLPELDDLTDFTRRI